MSGKKTIFFLRASFFCSFSFIHSFICFKKNEPEEEVFLLSTGRRRPCAERERERESLVLLLLLLLVVIVEETNAWGAKKRYGRK